MMLARSIGCRPARLDAMQGLGADAHDAGPPDRMQWRAWGLMLMMLARSIGCNEGLES